MIGITSLRIELDENKDLIFVSDLISCAIPFLFLLYLFSFLLIKFSSRFIHIISQMTRKKGVIVIRSLFILKSKNRFDTIKKKDQKKREMIF